MSYQHGSQNEPNLALEYCEKDLNYESSRFKYHVQEHQKRGKIYQKLKENVDSNSLMTNSKLHFPKQDQRRAKICIAYLNARIRFILKRI